MNDLQVQQPQIQSLSSQYDLPQELIATEILTRLPIKTLIRSKCVSRQWKSIISSPQFAKLHLQFHHSSPNSRQSLLINRDDTCFLTFDYTEYDSGQIIPDCGSSFDDSPRSKRGLVELELGSDLLEQIDDSDDRRPITIVGSCNGLVCLGFELGFLYLWNPATRESRKIPNPPSFRKKETIWGFGYVSSIDDYKIVTLSQKLHSYRKKAHTLTLKGGKWGKVNVLDGYNVDSLTCSGVVVDERVFWRMLNGVGLLCIVGFGLVEESFQEVGIPETLGNLRDFFLCAMGGCLCVSWSDIEGGVEVAMLKQYGDWGSWVKLYSFGCESYYCCNFFGLTRSGRVLMDTLEGSILLIDLSQEFPTYVEILTLAASRDVVPHVESLVSPFGLVENRS